MIRVTKVAEFLSGLLLLFFAVTTPHWELLPLFLAMIEGFAALFVAGAFPRRPTASVVAFALAAMVVAPVVFRAFANGLEVPQMDSPVVGFAFLPVAVLVVAQLVAAATAYSVLRHLK